MLPRFMGAEFSATTLSSLSLTGRAEGTVKSLSGYRKDRHTVPDAANATTQAFLAKLCVEELTDEAELYFQRARTALNYKRKDLSLDVSGGSAVLIARDFTFEITYTLVERDPSRYQITRTLQSLRNPELIHLAEFDALFARQFTAIVFTLSKGTSVEAVIDAVEALDDNESGLSVTYPSDYRECVLSVPGVEAVVRCTGGTLEMQFPRPGSPAELIAAFVEVQGAFVLSEDPLLAGLVAA